jgi:diguanylate cyclase (GGDEF)-like protein
MFDSLDLGTLQRCGMLASLCFAAMFVGQWRAGKDRAHLLCWAGAAMCHAITIAGFTIAGPSTGMVTGMMTGSLLYAAIAAGPVLIVAGVRSFDGRRPVARWMGIPILLAAAGHGVGQAIGGTVAVRLGATGLAAVAVMIAVALFRSRPDAVTGPGAGGRRMTGWAMLGYLPGYACVIAGVTSPAGLAAKLSMVDLLLTIFINLGLLAMPGQRAIAVMRERNHRDPLTGARSRAWLMAKAPALAEPGATVLVFDIDRFKQINDTLGHAAGDAVLIALIARLGDPVRAQGGRIVRLGGDEFAAILPATLSMGAAMRLAKLLRRIAAVTPAGVPACTISVGLAQVEAGDDRLDRAIARADRALYRAKAEGRDRVAA